MTTAAAVQVRAKPVNLRVREDTRALIDRAAKSQGKSRSEFMIDASRRAAEDALLDQTLLRVDGAAFARFVYILDRPPDPAAFERLMNAPRPWG